MWTDRHHLLFNAVALTVLSVVCSLAAEPQDASRFAVSGAGLPVEPAEDTDSACECTSIYDYELELLDTQKTRMDRPAKREKPPWPLWKPSRRRGLRRAWTTFYSVHLDEAVPVLDNRLPPDEVFDELFRCRGFGTRKRVDQKLVEAAIAAARHFKSNRIEVVSGYRSPKFNDALAKKGRHVATESKHTMGQAIDIRIVSAKAQDVGKWLFDNFDGGVGTYRNNNFVHIDVGPKRRW